MIKEIKEQVLNEDRNLENDPINQLILTLIKQRWDKKVAPSEKEALEKYGLRIQRTSDGYGRGTSIHSNATDNFIYYSPRYGEIEMVDKAHNTIATFDPTKDIAADIVTMLNNSSSERFRNMHKYNNAPNYEKRYNPHRRGNRENRENRTVSYRQDWSTTWDDLDSFAERRYSDDTVNAIVKEFKDLQDRLNSARWNIKYHEKELGPGRDARIEKLRSEIDKVQGELTRMASLSDSSYEWNSRNLEQAKKNVQTYTDLVNKLLHRSELVKGEAYGHRCTRLIESILNEEDVDFVEEVPVLFPGDEKPKEVELVRYSGSDIVVKADGEEVRAAYVPSIDMFVAYEQDLPDVLTPQEDALNVEEDENTSIDELELKIDNND